MSLLSDRDIKRELGKNIFIYPLNTDNIRGSTIDLSASRLAWSIKEKRNIFDDSSNEIIIPENDTALIETEETLFVTNRISGSYHSRVTLVSKGSGHIGTTLDPKWIGPSLIAVHNHFHKPLKIKVGQPFISIMFYYLKSKSKKHVTDTSGRPELLDKFTLTSSEKQWLDEDWKKDPEKLKKKMIECDEYKNLLKDRRSKLSFLKAPLSINLSCLLACAVTAFIFYKLEQVLPLQTTSYLIPIICVYLTVFTTQIMFIIKDGID